MIDLNTQLLDQLTRIAEALETGFHTHQSSNLKPLKADIVADVPALIWRAEFNKIQPIAQLKALDLDLLQGIAQAKQRLVKNTAQFATGHRANNALLWGQRGMGKSSLITATTAHVQRTHSDGNKLKLIEVNAADIDRLDILLSQLAQLDQFRFVLFCDDLKFDGQSSRISALKTLLDGGLQPRPDHIVFYATSNHRHLVAGDMAENEMNLKIHGGEVRDERLSLSDRFGISIGFHSCHQDDYLAMVDGYAKALGNIEANKELHNQAIAWAALRGHRSGRVAMQFITDYLARTS